MKRSEMVQRMAEYWVGLLPNENLENIELDPQLFEEVKERMGQMLSYLENKGMSSPSYEGVFATGEKYVKEKHFARDTACFNDWEPE
jgi:NOL1/NOP2/fmu family ribosome biogenesis protein